MRKHENAKWANRRCGMVWLICMVMILMVNCFLFMIFSCVLFCYFACFAFPVSLAASFWLGGIFTCLTTREIARVEYDMSMWCPCHVHVIRSLHALGVTSPWLGQKQDANRLTSPGTTPAFELSWMRCYDMSLDQTLDSDGPWWIGCVGL